MKNEKIKYGIMIAAAVALFVLFVISGFSWRITENTDILFPAQYFIDGMTRWYVVLIGLVLETTIIKLFFKESCIKSISMAFFINSVSAILGFATLFILSLIVELLFTFVPVGTFHVSHWVANLLLIIPMNAWIEGITARIAFKYKVKKTFLPLCVANAISVVVCFLLNLSWIGEMFF